jgi:hypothetical protein
MSDFYDLHETVLESIRKAESAVAHALVTLREDHVHEQSRIDSAQPYLYEALEELLTATLDANQLRQDHVPGPDERAAAVASAGAEEARPS